MAELAAELGDRAVVVTARPRRAAAAERLWHEASRVAGRVDVLVNNAGIYEVAELDGRPRRVSRLVGAHAGGLPRLPRGALPRGDQDVPRAGVGGIIVNLASRAAFRGEDPDYWHYAAAKAGVVAMTRTIARQYGRDGVTAFAVAPGIRQHPVQRRAGRALRARLLRRRTRDSARWPTRRTWPT